MAEKVYLKGSNGLVFTADPETAKGLLKHPNIEESTAEEQKALAGGRADAGSDDGGGNDDGNDDGAPRGNASRDAWAEYAQAQGVAAEDLEGKDRKEIRELLEARKQ